MTTRIRGRLVAELCASLMLMPMLALAQPVPGGACKPLSERKSEVGCWILAHDALGALPQPQMFWYLDVFPTRAVAEAAKSARGTVLQSLGRIWLLTIEEASWRSSAGERIARIGPLPIKAGEKYSAQYMEAIFTPGMTAPAHVHSGPEAWYTVAGETCLETPAGKQIGRAGGQHVIVPGGPPMHLTATGTEQRRAVVLILHETAKPASTLVKDWQPKGLCSAG